MKPWDWLKAELVRLLGEEESAALWAEYQRRQRQAARAQEAKEAPAKIVRYEREIAALAAEGRSTTRYERLIERLRRLQSGDE